MRTGFDTSFRNALAALERAGRELAGWQRQVSSGKRVELASDDPASAAAAITERGAIAAVDRYLHTTDSAESKLTVVDTVLSDIIRTITSARSAAARGDSSVLSDVQREAVALELEGLRGHILTSVSTQFRGGYLFSGAAVTTAPYTRNPDDTISDYQGDAGEVSVGVDRHISVKVTLAAENILKGTETEDVFAVLDDLAAAVRAGDTAGIATGQEALQRAFDRATAAQSQVGGALRSLGDVRARLGVTRRGHEAQAARHQESDLAASITEMTRAETAYRAALEASSTLGRYSLLDYIR